MSIEGLRNQLHREGQRVNDRRIRRMPCIVDGYNGTLHAVRVAIQPSGTLTGWVQIETPQVGLMIAPNVGDPGWLEFHEADRRAPIFVGSNHNDLKPPPKQIAAGEFYYQNDSGSSLYFKNDGSIAATDKGGASIALDGSGDITLTGKAGQTMAFDASGNITLTPTGSGKVRLGGASAQAAVRTGDPVSGGTVSGTSMKVVVA